MVRDFSEIPRGTERVIFFPQAAGGSHGTPLTDRDREADARARELLRSVAGEEVAAMYSELGFLGVEPVATATATSSTRTARSSPSTATAASR